MASGEHSPLARSSTARAKEAAAVARRLSSASRFRCFSRCSSLVEHCQEPGPGLGDGLARLPQSGEFMLRLRRRHLSASALQQRGDVLQRRICGRQSADAAFPQRLEMLGRAVQVAADAIDLFREVLGADQLQQLLQLFVLSPVGAFQDLPLAYRFLPDPQGLIEQPEVVQGARQVKMGQIGLEVRSAPADSLTGLRLFLDRPVQEDHGLSVLLPPIGLTPVPVVFEIVGRRLSGQPEEQGQAEDRPERPRNNRWVQGFHDDPARSVFPEVVDGGERKRIKTVGQIGGGVDLEVTELEPDAEGVM